MLGLFNRRKKFREGPLLTASTGAQDDWFGLSVALSADGNTAIAGAGLDDVGANVDQGSATIFVRSGTSWTQQQTVTQTGGAAGDYFGFGVALSSDGNTAIIGALSDDVGANANQGSATIFTRSGGVWTQQQTITKTGGAAGDLFGRSVALSADGNTAIVGAANSDVGANVDQGTATIFTRSGSVWTQQQTITQSTGAGTDSFGYAVALSSSGDTAIVGAYFDDVGANADQGSATIFTRSGSVWTEQQTITQTGGAAGDAFGFSVALSADGNTAIIGASRDDVGANTNQGSATIFTRSGSTWTQQQTITKTSGALNDTFGAAVAMSADGNTAIIGTNYADVGANADQGTATIFTRSGSIWTEQQTITQTGGAAGDAFGVSVALSSSGNIAIVGANYDDVGANTNQGSATIFYRR